MKPNKSALLFKILAFLGIYLLSTGISFAIFDQIGIGGFKSPGDGGELTEVGGELLVDISGPKTAECPLNGKMFTEAEKDRWSSKRPLFVMIENHLEARPQSGMQEADIIYETVAEGGITRFGSVFFCDAVAQEEIVGPVRSARTYFLDWASEYGPALYVHVGGAHCDPQTSEGCLNGGKADALGQIGDYGWEGENDLNQFSIGYPTFWRDYERIGHTVATEHTMYSTTERLWEVAEKRNWTNKDPEGKEWDADFVSWSFKDEAAESDRGSTGKISFDFWGDYSDYAVSWEYDSAGNVYKRSNGGKPHLDLNKDGQMTAKNLVIQFAKESPANDGYPGNVHLLYGTIDEGKALIFQDGKVIEGKWSKESRKGRTQFYDDKDKEIEFVRGKIWIEVLPKDNEVEY